MKSLNEFSGNCGILGRCMSSSSLKAWDLLSWNYSGTSISNKTRVPKGTRYCCMRNIISFTDWQTYCTKNINFVRLFPCIPCSKPCITLRKSTLFYFRLKLLISPWCIGCKVKAAFNRRYSIRLPENQRFLYVRYSCPRLEKRLSISLNHFL